MALLDHLVILGGPVSLTGFWVVLGTNQFGRSKNSGSPEPRASGVVGSRVVSSILCPVPWVFGPWRHQMLLLACSLCGAVSPSLPFRVVLLFSLSLVGGGAAFSSVLLGGAALSTPLCVVLLCPSPSVGWINFKKQKRHSSAHDVSRKVRPHRSYHVCILWHLQYLPTAVLCSTCPPQRGVVAKLCATVFRHVPML